MIKDKKEAEDALNTIMRLAYELEGYFYSTEYIHSADVNNTALAKRTDTLYRKAFNILWDMKRW